MSKAKASKSRAAPRKSAADRRAARDGCSVEEVREILRASAKNKDPRSIGLGTLFAQHFAGKGLTFEIPEWRGEKPRPAKFRR